MHNIWLSLIYLGCSFRIGLLENSSCAPIPAWHITLLRMLLSPTVSAFPRFMWAAR